MSPATLVFDIFVGCFLLMLGAWLVAFVGWFRGNARLPYLPAEQQAAMQLCIANYDRFIENKIYLGGMVTTVVTALAGLIVSVHSSTHL